MSYEFFREINTVLPLIAFGLLMYRTIHAWPAEWAKPDHVWHYRVLLIVAAIYVFASGMGAIIHEGLETQATVISLLYTLQAVAVLVLAIRWPKPRAMRKEPSPYVGSLPLCSKEVDSAGCE